MIRTLPSLVFFTLAAALSSCAQFPKLDAAAPNDLGPRPALLPTDQLPVAGKDTDIRTDNAAADDLQRSADALRAR